MHISKRYNLGPNGGIMTSLNLFTTKFDQVLTLIEKRAETVEYAHPPLMKYLAFVLISYELPPAT